MPSDQVTHNSPVTPIRILHVEDLNWDADLVRHELTKSGIPHQLKWVSNKTQYLEQLGTFNPDVILSDHSLPQFTSTQAYHILRNTGSDIPFILVTATVSEEFAVSMIKEGIDDYILKDRLQRLPNAIINALSKTEATRAQKKYIEEIVKKEKKFRALLEHTYESISLVDENLNVIYRSPSSQRITGYTNEELNHQSILQRVHADEKNILENLLADVMKSPDQPFRSLLRVLHKSGRYIWLETTFTNMLHDNNVNAIVLNYRDVTEQQEHEQELQRTSRHYRALIENISDALMLLDDGGVITYFSPSVLRITGYSATELKNRSVFDLLPDEEMGRARNFFSEMLSRTGQAVSNAFRMVRKDGELIWAEGTINNMLSDESVKGMVVNFRDITERRISEERISKSEANLRTVFNNTKTAFVLLDPDYNVISYNSLARDRYEQEMETILEEGANMLDIIPEYRREDSIEKFSRILKGEKISYETNFSSLPGSRWYQVDLLPVHDKVKNTLGIIISSEDITERKTADLEKDKMTAEIIQHNKNLEQFSYIISHNLRSPVANIMGLTNLIKNSPVMKESDFRKCIEGLSLSANKLDDVIVDLNFILQKRREINESREEVSFSGLINDIKTILKEIIAKENILIETNFSVNKLFTVRSYLHSIFYNLIINSIKYRNPEVRTVVNVSSIRKGKFVELYFRDNGLGIDLNIHGDKIFGLYKKFHMHVDCKGMGLYMVKTQVEIMGGHIHVNSKVNSGTEFIISLPDPSLG